MKLYDELGNEVTEDYVTLKEHRDAQENIACLVKELADLSKKKKKE